MLRIGIFLAFWCCMVYAAPQVTIPGLGTVEGEQRRSTPGRREFDSYKGIPFGMNTSLTRYKASLPAEPWEPQILMAKRYGRQCPQSCPLGEDKKRSFTYRFWKNLHEYLGDYETFAEMDYTRDDEDYEHCLFLNVYTPTRDPNANLPVMIFYHGGSFEYGSGAGYVPHFFMNHDMILVVPNYRLGALGFLSMQNAEIPGNAGMLDQVLALEWTYNHIHAFGGDPTKITVFGESAGAASVSLLALSPLTKGLMRGVIAESGAAFAEWAFDREPLYNGRGVAEEAGCNMTSDETMTQCILAADPCTILQAQDDWSNKETARGKSGFGAGCPTYQTAGDRIFLDRSPAEVWESENFTAVPSIYGANKHEGTYVLGIVIDDFLEKNGLLDDEDFMTYDIVRPFFTMFGVSDNGNTVTDSVEYEYVGIERMGNLTAMSPGLIDFGGSTFLKAPGYESNIRHAQFGNSYQYAFNFHGPLTYPICRAIVDDEQKYPFPPGICHAAEIVLLFGNRLTYLAMSEEEQLMSNRMVKMWYNFAAYGNPTPSENPVDDIEWRPYEPATQYYLRFDDNITLRTDYKLNEYRIAKDENFGLT